ncbi:hypothetical protein TSUD_53620 [Trifolium subterraneum]|uniref:RNase H type-1 domain-containing protein n=1 Tax=Trifolium subterraneum TaxID=3900 RepID=A0A2Z6N8K2_TRISU|nr:hypothetical protein TSUD_53620 [Trifolium subterraneum]
MPASGWVCLNTDGASKGEAGASGCGGILRHDNGTWIAGFAKFLGNTTTYMAEIWGLYESLCLARNLGITRLEVQVDSEALVKAIQGSNVGGNMYWNIMKKIQELLNLN